MRWKIFWRTISTHQNCSGNLFKRIVQVMHSFERLVQEIRSRDLFRRFVKEIWSRDPETSADASDQIIAQWNLSITNCLVTIELIFKWQMFINLYGKLVKGFCSLFLITIFLITKFDCPWISIQKGISTQLFNQPTLKASASATANNQQFFFIIKVTKSHLNQKTNEIIFWHLP